MFIIFLKKIDKIINIYNQNLQCSCLFSDVLLDVL